MKKLTKVKEELVRQEISCLKLSQDLGINHSQLSLMLNGWAHA